MLFAPVHEQAEAKPHYHGHRQRLRERFLKSGAASLADYELLEMMLFSAHPRGDVKPLAKALLAKFGSFAKVVQADIPALEKIDGVSDATIAAIKVVEAASQRLLREEVTQKTVIASWQALLDYCRLKLGHRKEEAFHVLFLNHKLALIADEEQQKGTINHTPVYPREVVKRALELGAAGIILMHNHPTGDVKPSRADIEMTNQIVAAAKPLGITVHDHLIIGGDKHYSFKSKGHL